MNWWIKRASERKKQYRCHRDHRRHHRRDGASSSSVSFAILQHHLHSPPSATGAPPTSSFLLHHIPSQHLHLGFYLPPLQAATDSTKIWTFHYYSWRHFPITTTTICRSHCRYCLLPSPRTRSIPIGSAFSHLPFPTVGITNIFQVYLSLASRLEPFQASSTQVIALIP